ncbi:MAG: recombinase RecT [Bacillati bacterium]
MLAKTEKTAGQSIEQHLGIPTLMLNALRSQIAPPGCPDEVLALYAYRCKAIGADLFARLLYISKRRTKDIDKWTIELTIDGLRAIAESSGKYDGQDLPILQFNDKGLLVSATVTVYRKDFARGIAATAYYDEYVQTDRDGSTTRMWIKMGKNQLAKCAEALALRKAFPRLLSGLYTSDEMAQAENHDLTPAARAALNGQRAQTQTANTPTLMKQVSELATKPTTIPNAAEPTTPQARQAADAAHPTETTAAATPPASDQTTPADDRITAAQLRFINDAAQKAGFLPARLQAYVVSRLGPDASLETLTQQQGDNLLRVLINRVQKAAKATATAASA